MTVPENLILRDIAGDCVLVPVGELALRLHGMISLSESGALLFRRLQNGATAEELVQALLAEYAVDEATAAADAEEFVNRLRALDLIID